MYKPENGESTIELQQRVVNFFKDYISSLSHSQILIITYGGVITTFGLYLQNQPFEDYDQIKPDLFNYASLGNSVRHLHIHLIPRYKKKRDFMNKEFSDERFGHHYKPFNKEFKIDKVISQKLKSEIKERLK